ncbi:MAG: response regulator [Nitrospirales bacterium]
MAHILIVDDDRELRNLLALSLAEAGHYVVEAREGREGLALQHLAPLDLVITDILMPGVDGFETIKRLRQEYPKLRIFAMSGVQELMGMDVRMTARCLGAARTFNKPLSVQEVLRAVREEFPTGPIPAR